MTVCAQCGRHNPPGSRFCTEQSCGAFLDWDESGAQAAPEPPAAARSGEHPGARRIVPTPERHSVQVQLTQREVAVDVGSTATVEVTTVNNGTIVEELEVQVSGPAAAWSTVDLEQLSLFPSKHACVRISFSPPRAADTPSGPMPFEVTVTSRVHDTVTGSVSGVLVVAGFAAPTVQISPHTATARLRGRHRLTVTNGGNLPMYAAVTASDRDETLRFQFDPPVLTMPAGAQASVTIRSRPCKPLWWGTPQRTPFTVDVHANGQPPISTAGAVEQVPLVPRAALPIAVLVVLLALAGGGWTLVGHRSGNDSTAPIPSPTVWSSVSPPGSPTVTASTPAASAFGQSTVASSTQPPPPPPTTQQPPPPPPPPPTQPVHRQSRYDIEFSYIFDLDEGCYGLDCPTNTADIWYSADNDGVSNQRFLSISNAMGIAPVGRVEPTYDACRNARFSEVKIVGDNLRAGNVICVRTDKRRIAAVRIEQDPGNYLSISYTTWENQ